MENVASVQQPLDLIRLTLDEYVYIKSKGNREITGKLHAYDEHCNIILEDAVETITVITEDPETGTESTSVNTKNSDVLFVRGDSIILVSPKNQ
ncbi:U6 snRNA-associated Sm-like protein LSm3 [Babesia microti strain RI]|uniref:U6 snRNA-associated Sm-like protein LSm3 n=1 Tax=Babesia microti (strain RI) TaxID=1133968 RepID=I7J5L7_BABMR|nr:U6 snRNA-associated Sm-like protein LSm3 [Babesia microti strain RI]CCF73012.1 U6 snRNA-associated Sm-like protein LSm3 [Babesia microti strain RI]|eukprot:XP_012647621.1 U6 snRNA-associated Sm-like protein LSm3 [Babesia microti strain RI]